MAITFKPVIDESYLRATASGVEGVMKYYVDTGGANNFPDNTVGVPAGYDKIITAFALKIGDKFGGSLDNHFVGSLGNDPNLRVKDIYVSASKTGNAKRMFLNCQIATMQPYQETIDTALFQRKTGLYLSSESDNNYKYPNKRQIVLTYLNPVTKIAMPPVPGYATEYAYMESRSISNTFYADEMAAFQGRPTNINGTMEFLKLWARTVNNSIMYGTYFERTLLCNGVSVKTNDAWNSCRVQVDFLYNPESWDSVVIATDKMTSGGVIVPENAIDSCHATLTSDYNPIIPKDAGIGKFPLYNSSDMEDLVGIIKKTVNS